MTCLYSDNTALTAYRKGCRCERCRSGKRRPPPQRGRCRIPAEGQTCAGCGIPLSDGYATACDHCSNRRQRRLKRGELFTPTCFAGEMIDNRTGRIVASGGIAA